MRIRSIKPEFWSSPDTASCADPWTRLLFIGMWNVADDLGRGTANPKELAGDIFPNDEWAGPAEVRRMLGGIRRSFGVEFYVVGGRPYFAIPSFARHQKFDKRSASRHPGPDEGQTWNPEDPTPSDQRRTPEPADPADTPPDVRRDPPDVRRDPPVGTGEQGNRGTGEQGQTHTLDEPADGGGVLALVQPQAAPAVRVTAEPAGFAAFWQACPRKVGKGKAEAEYVKAMKKGAGPERLRLAMESAAVFWRRSQTEARYIPHPATWLAQGRWDDDTSRPEAPAGSTTARIESGNAALEEFRRRRGMA